MRRGAHGRNDGTWNHSVSTGIRGKFVSGINSWDKIAFESIRDWQLGNLHLKCRRSNSTRLTINSASDIEPRMTRGAQRIVFASNRTGNYELYTMNADGSNLIRLTFTNTNNYNPTWSPDGTRIAFESYRDGQAEVISCLPMAPANCA